MGTNFEKLQVTRSGAQGKDRPASTISYEINQKIKSRRLMHHPIRPTKVQIFTLIPPILIWMISQQVENIVVLRRVVIF